MYRRPLCSRLERPRHGAAHISSHGLEGVCRFAAPHAPRAARSPCRFALPHGPRRRTLQLSTHCRRSAGCWVDANTGGHFCEESEHRGEGRGGAWSG